MDDFTDDFSPCFGSMVELKFVTGTQDGVFEGYGAVFGNQDSHGDVILPGAFAKSLAAHKSAGTMPGMYVEHAQFTGIGDPLPVGKYLDISEDDKGLRVKGRLSALDTDHGKRLRSLMQDGVLNGLSIAYRVPPGGSLLGKRAGEPRRTLREVQLHAVDIVRDPSNSFARVSAVKSVRFEVRGDLEDFLEAKGLSRGAARKIARGGWSALAGDEDETEQRKAESMAQTLRKFRETLKGILK